MLAGLYLVVRKYENFRKKEGYYEATVYEDQELPIPNKEPFKLFSYATFYKLFVQRWSFMTGGILLALMFAFILISTGHSWGVTGPFVSWGCGLPAAVWGAIYRAGFADAVATANGGILNDPGSLRNIGIILGAAIAFLLAGRLAFDGKFKVKDVIYYLIGGF